MTQAASGPAELHRETTNMELYKMFTMSQEERLIMIKLLRAAFDTNEHDMTDHELHTARILLVQLEQL